jgi:hypothetical protein
MKKVWSNAELEVLDMKFTAGGNQEPPVPDSDHIACNHDTDPKDGTPDHLFDNGYGTSNTSPGR